MDLAATTRARRRWPSYGFSDGWREDGYVVGFDLEDADEGRRAMVALAVKYAQGAIYEYAWVSERTMRRRTVPAAMSEAVDADVIMVCCDEPEVQEG
jgi:nucleoside-triphosphatase THEP1